MPEGERPPVMRGMVISDPNDPSPPQNIYAVTTLTPGQLARLRADIKRERARLSSKREVPAFGRAVLWVYKVYGYDVHLDSAFVPMPTYGASFDAFVDFIYKKERDAEAEAILEDEEGAPTG